MINKSDMLDILEWRVNATKNIRTDSSVKLEGKDESKKVSEVRDVLSRILSYIDYFNEVIDDDTRIIDEHFIEDWFVIEEFKDFISPSSIRFDAGNKRWKDLKYQEITKKGKSTDFSPSYNDFESLQARFRSFYRKDVTSGVITLKAAKEPVSLANYIDRVAINDKVRALDKPQWYFDVIPECEAFLADQSLFVADADAERKLFLDNWLL